MKPPFRADHVGSLLRPARLKEAREKHRLGALSAAGLAAVEDREIEAVIGRQRDIGLRLATDGELRRAVWSLDFLEHLVGVEGYETEGVQFKGVVSVPRAARVIGRVDFDGHPMLDHFRFLKGRCATVAKMTVPAPPVLHFRIGRNGLAQAYPDLDAFFGDLAFCYRKVVAAFYDAGCRYLQFDDTVWAFLCSEPEREASRRRGDDPDALPAAYARTINAAIAGRPADMAITTHVCRGNFRSTWVSEGGYEPVAETLLAAIDYDGYFLEYDTERAGGFEPLRFLPKGDKRVVLGLVTSKFGELETADDIKRRIDEATRYVALDQLCISPQCGFASTQEGNLLAEDEQWAKLELVAEVARQVWDDA
jgi:5-methyltetrahydropteroyltriglutamate--homocysteine methyltransferase